MPALKGSRTEVNLLTAFAGESQARNRYTFAASRAVKEGFVKIASVFTETADQEKEHAKRLFGFLEGNDVQISAVFPAGASKAETAFNLAAAAAGEKHEWTIMYPEFSKIAKEEGFPEIADVMTAIAVAEKHHERRFNDFLDELNRGVHFKKPQKTFWRCRNCGYVHEGLEPPSSCPACAHPMGYFEDLGR